ncbi:hypothetical protein PoB_006948400 [Plakobranchus ocellatus]|uniref:Uncharacterized protein n=1 Tax=Plakobranchus ocellatus TaxID=259542 RepID=A0AAV4DFJ1_9GAST|nr:hypothetical protein PoB_006948400 [Plakobranchus ocellatus]
MSPQMVSQFLARPAPYWAGDGSPKDGALRPIRRLVVLPNMAGQLWVKGYVHQDDIYLVLLPFSVHAETPVCVFGFVSLINCLISVMRAKGVS